jgi:hypothetical protein
MTVATASISSTAPTTQPAAATTMPTASAATPSASAQPIADGTYAAKPVDVTAIKARINADTKLTAAQKADIIDHTLGLDGHKTFVHSLDFHNGQYTELQAFDGAAGSVGQHATFAFPNDHTLVIQEVCCGISTFEVTPDQLSFTLKVNSPAGAGEVDVIVGQILFESSPFTLVP